MECFTAAPFVTGRVGSKAYRQSTLQLRHRHLPAAFCKTTAESFLQEQQHGLLEHPANAQHWSAAFQTLAFLQGFEFYMLLRVLKRASSLRAPTQLHCHLAILGKLGQVRNDVEHFLLAFKYFNVVITKAVQREVLQLLSELTQQCALSCAAVYKLCRWLRRAAAAASGSQSLKTPVQLSEQLHLLHQLHQKVAVEQDVLWLQERGLRPDLDVLHRAEQQVQLPAQWLVPSK